MAQNTVAQVSALNIDSVGYLSYTEELSDVWGHVDSTGIEYALVGVYDGLSIVSLEVPSAPTEVAFFPGLNSIWRDMHVWDNHIYCSNDGGGQGLLIVDANPLPNATAMTSKFFTQSADTNDSISFTRAHNIWIDSTGFLYVFGANYGDGNQRGAIIYDLKPDPMNPVLVGYFNDNYLHDGYVRGNVLYGAAIYEGTAQIIDIANRANPTIIAQFGTSSAFCHNTWLSDDGNTLYTTDERANAYVDAIDITNINNMSLLDKYQSSPGDSVIPHNVHVMNDYLYTSYYKDGVTVVDASDPNNLIEIGHFDGSPMTGKGFGGNWGAYPYLPSGLLLMTDIQTGFWVLQPNLVRAGKIQGNINDSLTNFTIPNATISFSNGMPSATSNILGVYKSGGLSIANFTMTVAAPGYHTKTISNLSLTLGQTTIESVELRPLVAGIQESAQATMRVWPNPAGTSNTVNVKLDGDIQSHKWFDLNGREVAIGGASISAPESAGVYFLEVASESGVDRVRLVVR